MATKKQGDDKSDTTISTGLDTKGLPIDTGWAWIIAASYGTAMFIVVGFFKAFGIFFVAIQEEFDASASITSVISGLEPAVYSLTAVLVLNMGLSLLSIRRCVMIGGVLATIGFLVIGFSPNVGFIIFAYGVVCGVAFAFVTGPATAIVGTYFKKRRGLAYGLGQTLCGIGGLVYPLVLRALIDFYTVRGAAIVIAGFMLNLVVVGALLRPLEFYQKRNSSSDRKLLNDGDSEKGDNQEENVHINSFEQINVKLPEKNYYHRNGTEPLIDNDNDLHGKDDLQIEVVRSEKNSSEHVSSSVNNARRLKTASESGSVSSATVGRAVFFSSPSDFRYGSSIDIALPAVNSGSRNKADSRFSFGNDDSSRCCLSSRKGVRGWCVKLAKLIDCHVLKMSLFQMFVCVAVLSIPATVLFTLFIPPHGKDIGIDEQTIALLMSINAIADIAGRMLWGIIADRGWIKSSNIIALCMVVTACCLHLCRLSENFISWIIIVVVYGVFSGSYFVLLPVVVMDYVGVSNLPGALGVLALCHGMSIGVCVVIIGAIRDAVGSYTAAFHMLGTFHIISAAILLLEPIARRRDEKKKKQPEYALSVEISST